MIPVVAIIDVGKTNKKLFLFDENYNIVFEKSARFFETIDEDEFPCENLESLRLSVFDSLSEVFKLKKFQVKAVNFSTYGASLVNIGEDGKPLTPLYNYLKPYPEELSSQLYARYGGEEQFSIQTASPILGSLNSGLQLYRLKKEQPEIFAHLKYALHLPQYLSSLLTGTYSSDMTSIGCHTAMWDFHKKSYHQWIEDEGLESKLAPIMQADQVTNALFPGTKLKVGFGLHDSSAALIPYLVNFHEPFIVISTGTWCITMNPFDTSPLTAAELKKDCLCYLGFQGKPIKASRLFSGHEHEEQVKRIAEHFMKDVSRYRNVSFDPEIIVSFQQNDAKPNGKTDTKNATRPDAEFKVDLENKESFQTESVFGSRELSSFKNDIEAYHQLILDMIQIQVYSTNLVLTGTRTKRIFVDGGFSKNSVFMHLLAASFPEIEVFASSMAQATAAGAALTIHREWSSKPIPNDIIQLKYYSASHSFSL